MTISPDHFSLAGKVAIVTGAGGRAAGIGEAYASALAVFGADVVVADINEAGAVAAARRIAALGGGKATGVALDVTDPASIAALMARTREEFGGLDILVNNAALMLEAIGSPASTIALDYWQQILAVNLTGPLLCAQAAVPLMAERGGGRIVNQASAGAYPAQSVYGVSKLALVGLTTTLATELGRSGITVNAIAPGITDSGAGLSMRGKPSRYFQILSETNPLPATDTPDALTGALLYLCSEAGRWTTGQVLHVDGGAVMRP